MHMNATFMQKVVLTLIAAFFAACLVEFYMKFVDGADDALNAGYKHRYGMSEPASVPH